jgi:hypothetical protein
MKIKNDEQKYKIGDVVIFEECWEDESGGYHDESATILAIDKDGKLELEWHLDRYENAKEIEEFLESCEFKIDDIAYLG